MSDGRLSVAPFRSTQQDASRPFRTPGRLDHRVLGWGESEFHRDRAAFAFGKWRTSGAGVHDSTIAGHRKIINLLDRVTYAGYIKYMNTAASIKLQSLGTVAAKPVAELRVGDTMHFNFGQTAEVVSIEGAGTKSVRVGLVCASGYATVKLMRIDRLVAA